MRPKVILLLAALLLWVSFCEKNPNGPEEESQAKLVFVMKDTTVGPLGLYTMNLDGTGMTAIGLPGDTIQTPVGPHVVPEFGGFSHPRWSPDGKMIACEYITMFDAAALSLMNSDGTNKRILPLSYGSAYRPQWSPEGNRIMFMRGIYLGAVVAIGIIDISGENDHDFNIAGEPPHTPVIFKSDSIWFYSYAAHGFQWGPTGSQIYATGLVNERPDPSKPLFPTTAMEIFSLNSSSGTIITRITNNTIDETRFRLSPNGHYFALQSGKYGHANSIFVHALDDGAIIEISVDNTVNYYWNWSSDSKSIVFAKDENPDPYINEDLYLYVANIEQPDKLTRLSTFMALMPDLFVPAD